MMPSDTISESCLLMRTQDHKTCQCLEKVQEQTANHNTNSMKSKSTSTSQKKNQKLC